MKERIEDLPEEIREHLWEITRTSGLEESDESYRRIGSIWLEKKRLFEQQIRSLRMEEIQRFSGEDARGALILTWSGSLLSLGCRMQGRRWAEYASIRLRKNVPNLALMDDVHLAADPEVNRPAEFDRGPIRSTSALLKIAVCSGDVSFEEQEKRIREATIFLTNGFVKLNRTLALEAEARPDQFTMKTMIAYVAGKNGLSQKQARQVIQDYLLVVETGLLLGERPALGRLGKISLRVRQSRQARVIRNPATGERMTLESRPAVAVPKMHFSEPLKNRAALVEVESDRSEEG